MVQPAMTDSGPGVAVGVDVRVGVAVRVGVGVTVRVGDGVAVAVGVLVGGTQPNSQRTATRITSTIVIQPSPSQSKNGSVEAVPQISARIWISPTSIQPLPL